MQLHWESYGPESDTTIIFLHEGLGCIPMWKGYPEMLCNELRTKGIAYDRSGYGQSPGNLKNRKADYLHLAAEELNDFIEHLALKSVILYGHSDGGSIALIHASKYPAKVKAVITEAAHAFNEDVTIQGVKEARPLMAEGKMEALRKYHGDRYQEVFYAWNDIWLHESFEDWDISESLPKINCPNLIIQGKDDQYGTLHQVDTIEQLTSGKTTRCTPSNCGHAPFKEQQEIVLENVKQFINAIV